MYGIDVSKNTLDICLYVDGVRGCEKFENGKEGFKKLLQWSKIQASEMPQTCCLEATGRYHEELADFLVEHGFTVYPVNGYRINCYRKSIMQRKKTDLTDAMIIAQYGEKHEKELYSYVPLSPARRTMKGLARLRWSFTQQLVRHKNQVKSLSGSSIDDPIRKLLRKSLRTIQRQIVEIDEEMRKVILSDLWLCIVDELVRSIPGISYISSTRIIAELPSNTNSVKAWDQYAGFVGCENESGTSVHHQPQCSRISNARLRTAFYMPALAVSKMDNPLGAFYTRLLEKGKKPMVAMMALMRKLLHIVFGVLKHLNPYDPSLVGPIVAEKATTINVANDPSIPQSVEAQVIAGFSTSIVGTVTDRPIRGKNTKKKSVAMKRVTAGSEARIGIRPTG
jgi:transposase